MRGLLQKRLVLPCVPFAGCRWDCLEEGEHWKGGTNAEGDRNAVVLAALRIAVGPLFLIFGQYKVFGTQFTLGGGFQSWINRFLAEGA
jgi:hypothetical protein